MVRWFVVLRQDKSFRDTVCILFVFDFFILPEPIGSLIPPVLPILPVENAMASRHRIHTPQGHSDASEPRNRVRRHTSLLQACAGI